MTVERKAVPAWTLERETILAVDDDTAVLEVLSDLFIDDYSVLTAGSGEEAVRIASDNQDLAAVIMDIRMAGLDGIAAARELRKLTPLTRVIFHTGFPGDYDEDEIDRCEHPFDYIQKGEAISRLTRSVRNAVGSYRLQRDSRPLTSEAEASYGMFGRSRAMQDVYRLIRKVSATDGKVVITGETGTGKELVARAIHYNSIRQERRLAILNCNHKSPDLVESELFGHLKGSFTGAVEDRIGLFEYANGGTIFLDEIGDLDFTSQAKLLRVLETGEFQRIGSPLVQHTNVRIICATNRNLERMVVQDQFRGDLYFRLKGVTIQLPAMRDRREDIPLLINRFKDRYTIEQGLTPKVFADEAIEVMINFAWPGNVRQLLETVESLIVLSDSDLILAEDVSRYLSQEPETEPPVRQSLSGSLRDHERNLIVAALASCKYNVSAAARQLRIDRANLSKKIRFHGIDLSGFRDQT